MRLPRHATQIVQQGSAGKPPYIPNIAEYLTVSKKLRDGTIQHPLTDTSPFSIGPAGTIKHMAQFKKSEFSGLRGKALKSRMNTSKSERNANNTSLTVNARGAPSVTSQNR